MTETSHAVYLIGSEINSFRSINAKFHYDHYAKKDKWKELQNLKQGRHSHAAIMIGRNTIIVGGKTWSDHSDIEIWDFETDEAITVNPSPENLDSYKRKFYKGIAVFPVKSDFCKK